MSKPHIPLDELRRQVEACHACPLAEGRTQKTEDVVKVGDIVTAKCIGIDDKGRVKMSMRAAARDRKAAEAAAAEQA